jgi:uncharacterized membrane protein
VILLVGIAGAGLAAGYALKAQCNNRAWDGIQYRRSCYNDVLPLYYARGLNEKRFPYIHSTEQTRRDQKDLEYPVGTGLYVGTVAETTRTGTGFFNANAVGIALMGLAAAASLAALALEPRRVLLFAVGPALILYSFHNWDLLAVGLATLALLAYARRADAWSGFLLGLGAATKLYPAFLLPALLLGAWRRGRRPPWAMAAAFIGGAALLNVPVMLANFRGWKYPWDFQSMRSANYETLWFMLHRHIPGPWFFNSTFVNLASAAGFVVGAAVLIAIELKRQHPRPFALGFGILVMFLLTAKVFSPQYALWLLPFFALLRLPWWSYVAFAITDAAVWFAVSYYFLVAQFHDLNDPAWAAVAEHRLDLLEYAVWARYLALFALLVLSVYVKELIRDRPDGAPVPLSA